ncbi:hypothetical protein [Neptunicella sp. SCSIO 80796]|uniref:hypothetical protein n=1 Tax=Neptunicella plasticusilytica TaxID=3117012 RepID=UPI003A4DDA15
MAKPIKIFLKLLVWLAFFLDSGLKDYRNVMFENVDEANKKIKLLSFDYSFLALRANGSAYGKVP